MPSLSAPPSRNRHVFRYWKVLQILSLGDFEGPSFCRYD